MHWLGANHESPYQDDSTVEHDRYYVVVCDIYWLLSFIWGLLTSVPAFWTVVGDDFMLVDLCCPPFKEGIFKELNTAAAAEEGIFVDEEITDLHWS